MLLVYVIKNAFDFFDQIVSFLQSIDKSIIFMDILVFFLVNFSLYRFLMGYATCKSIKYGIVFNHLYLLLQNRTGVYVTFLRAAANTNRPVSDAIFKFSSCTCKIFFKGQQVTVTVSGAKVCI